MKHLDSRLGATKVAPRDLRTVITAVCLGVSLGLSSYAALKPLPANVLCQFETVSGTVSSMSYGRC